MAALDAGLMAVDAGLMAVDAGLMTVGAGLMTVGAGLAVGAGLDTAVGGGVGITEDKTPRYYTWPY